MGKKTGENEDFIRSKRLAQYQKYPEMEKEKIEYPDLTLGNKKATSNEEKVNLFKQFLETTFITEPEHKICHREKELIEKDI